MFVENFGKFCGNKLNIIMNYYLFYTKHLCNYYYLFCNGFNKEFYKKESKEFYKNEKKLSNDLNCYKDIIKEEEFIILNK